MENAAWPSVSYTMRLTLLRPGRNERGNALAMRWLIRSARARTGKTMSEKLAGELMDAAAGQGATIKRREETHKMAESNKAFAHYRW